MSKYRISKLTVEEFEKIHANNEDATMHDAAIDIIRDYHLHKNKERLAGAVRSGSKVVHKILEEPELRSLIADVLEGTYKPSKGHRKRLTIDKQNKIFNKFNYYRAMGVSIEKCISFTANDCHIAKYTLEKEILGSGKYDPDLTKSPFSMGWVDGIKIKLMNMLVKDITGEDIEEPPQNIKEIRSLEKMYAEVLDSEARKEVDKEAMKQVMEMNDSYKQSDTYKKIVGVMLKGYVEE